MIIRALTDGPLEDLAEHGLHGLQGFFLAAQGLHGLHGFIFAAQGLHGFMRLTAQGLHGFIFAAQGLHGFMRLAAQGLHGFRDAAALSITHPMENTNANANVRAIIRPRCRCI